MAETSPARSSPQCSPAADARRAIRRMPTLLVRPLPDRSCRLPDRATRRTIHAADRTVHAAFQAVEAPFRTSSAGIGRPGLCFRTSLARFRAVERRVSGIVKPVGKEVGRGTPCRSRAARGAEAGIVVRNRPHLVLVKQWPITRWCGGNAQSPMVQRRYSPMNHASEPEKTVPTYHRISSKRARIARASSRVNTSSPPNSFSTGCRFRWNRMNRDYMDVMLLGGTG